MAVICAIHVDGPPPAWAVIVVGGAMIVYGLYLGKKWRDEDRTIQDAALASLILIVGGGLIVYGATLLIAP